MRLASRPPIRCSGCYGQYVERPHVDFESSYDGPSTDSENPRAPHLDWVVLCQECIEAAHSMLPDTRDVAADLTVKNEELQRELDAANEYAANLENAVNTRPERAPQRPRVQIGRRKGRYEAPEGATA